FGNEMFLQRDNGRNGGRRTGPHGNVDGFPIGVATDAKGKKCSDCDLFHVFLPVCFWAVCPCSIFYRTSLFSSSPSPWMVTFTTSPAFMNSGGLRAKPTPDGVPVAMISPGSSVMIRDRCSMIAATPKIMYLVLEDCLMT